MSCLVCKLAFVHNDPRLTHSEKNMLDSTGKMTVHRVPCVFCPRVIVLEEYCPEHGHDGQPINEGSWVVPTRELLEGALITLFRIEDKIERGNYSYIFDEYPIRRHHSHYAMYGIYVPPFGLEVGKVLWICQSCDALITASGSGVKDVFSQKCGQWDEFLKKHAKLVESEQSQPV
jgi:hypothetical protein